jgi:hypothetical protein
MGAGNPGERTKRWVGLEVQVEGFTARTVSVALGLLLVDLVVETEEVDSIGEGRAALDRASLDSRDR